MTRARAARAVKARAAKALDGRQASRHPGLRERVRTWGLGSSTESGVEGAGVRQLWRGGWRRPLILRAPLRAAPGRLLTSRVPPRKARRATRRSCSSSRDGGSIQIVVGDSPSLARLPWANATWGVLLLGDPMPRKVAPPWASTHGGWGDVRASASCPSWGGLTPLGSPSPVVGAAAPEETISRPVPSASGQSPALEGCRRRQQPQVGHGA